MAPRTAEAEGCGVQCLRTDPMLFKPTDKVNIYFFLPKECVKVSALLLRSLPQRKAFFIVIFFSIKQQTHLLKDGQQSLLSFSPHKPNCFSYKPEVQWLVCILLLHEEGEIENLDHAEFSRWTDDTFFPASEVTLFIFFYWLTWDTVTFTVHASRRQ